MAAHQASRKARQTSDSDQTEFQKFYSKALFPVFNDPEGWSSNWVKEYNIDGYRMGSAGTVPTDFWNTVRVHLDKLKPVFMLADAEKEDLHESAFDMSYGWELLEIMKGISNGQKNVNHIVRYMDRERERFPENSYRMYFTTNHSENANNGTVFERFKQNYEAFAVLTSTMWGMPLVYSGQEAGLKYPLETYGKSEIIWEGMQYSGFFSNLLQLNRKNPALWNGTAGGDLTFLYSDSTTNVLAYKRTHESGEVLVLLNFGRETRNLTFKTQSSGSYKELFKGDFKTGTSLSLSIPAHAYKVYVKEK